MSSDTAPSSAAPPTQVEPPAADRPAPTTVNSVAWPKWFEGFDVALAVMAVVLGFLVTSFVARNADFWRHIAVGRLVTQFKYPFGGEPFTYSAADSVWVNPNWVSEVALYVLYSLDTSGAVAVAVKAMAAAAAFGVLFLLRKPAFPLWPWAVAIAIGTVGTCAHTHLRPYVFGLVMTSITLVVLGSGDWAGVKRWRRPLILGGVVALWANLDAFAFLAPVAVALLLVGELIQDKLLKGTTDPTAADPFFPVPPVPALGRALVCTLVACLLNPTFLMAVVKDPAEAVAQLVPFELDFATADVLRTDDDLKRYTYPGLNENYRANTIHGKNVSGLAAAVLTGLGVLGAAVGYRAGRASHLVLWIGFAVLAGALHARFIPHLMLVSVPFVAAHLNALGGRLDLTRLKPQSARTLASVCRAGRVATAGGLVILMLAAVPGWLQPYQNTGRPIDRAMDRWVAWGVEPEEGTRRMAELLQEWRQPGSATAELLRDARGMNTGPEFGDFCAWFAPDEKVFLTSRYRLHRGVMADAVRLRRLIGKPNAADDPDERPITALLEKYGAGFIHVGQPYFALYTDAVSIVQQEFAQAAVGQATGPAEPLPGSLWHVDGRFAVLGRLDSADAIRRSRGMTWDAARQAFGTSRPRTDGDPDLTPKLVQEGWLVDYLTRPKMPPPEVDDAAVFCDIHTAQQNRLQGRRNLWQFGLVPGASALGGGPVLLQASLDGPPAAAKPAATDFALPVLAVRNARAGARLADSGPAFLVLSEAYQQPLLPELEPGENRTQILTALTRGLDRYPSATEGQAMRGMIACVGTGMRLIGQHLRGQSPMEMNVDLARTVLADVTSRLRAASDDDQRIAGQVAVNVWTSWLGALNVYTQAMQPNAQIPPQQVFDFWMKQGVLAKSDIPSEWVPKDGSPPAPDVAIDRLGRLDQSMLEMIRKITDQVERQAGQRPIEEKFQIYIAQGLSGRALELVEEAGDPSKGGTVTPSLNAKYIGLLQRVGRLEQAFVHRRFLEEALGSLTDGGDTKVTDLRQLNRQFELTEAKLAGNYKKADTLLEEQFRSQPLPAVTDQQRALLRPPPLELVVGTGMLAGPQHMFVTDVTRDALQRRLLYETRFWFQRGLFALYDGDTKLAREHLDRAANPQGVELTSLGLNLDDGPFGTYLPKYRELLTKYAEK